MPQLQLLQFAKSLSDLAGLLEFKPAALSYILYKKPPASKYTEFQIAKRSGGTRTIHAPCPELKLLQHRLSDLLQNCVSAIDTKRGIEDQLAHGFKRKRSIITNATKHRKRNHVFNIDLNEFFPSINFGRVRGFFIKDTNFGLDPRVATVLAQIACHNNSLPQGSPCSPVISNLIGRVLDIHLCKLASKHRCTYSRYADDITFSSNKRTFPVTLAEPVNVFANQWRAGTELVEVITSAGFAINPTKTRLQYRRSRQDVTGLVVNRKVNIRAEYRRTVRAMAQRLFNTGEFDLLRPVADASGLLSSTKIKGKVPQLQGMFGHIDAVDVHNRDFEVKATKDKAEKQSIDAALRSKQKLYRRFLMFKDFYQPAVPVVVCEGKTDYVYLRHAIKKLAAHYPTLASPNNAGKTVLKLRLIDPQTTTGRLLQLGTGTGGLKEFLSHYVDEIKKFKAAGMQRAVIVLLDNDSGANDILLLLNKITSTVHTRTTPYIHVSGNLYVVLTPLVAGQQESMIEDFFQDTVINVVLGGKTFSAVNGKGFDATKHFGKEILSRYVEENAHNIDFSNFAGILDRISAAIESHAAKLAPPLAANAAMP